MFNGKKIIRLQKYVEELEKNISAAKLDFQFKLLEMKEQYNTESFLITALAHQINQKDLNNLKASLLRPFLETKWKEEKREDGQKIINKGEKIIDERNRLHDDMLQQEKRGGNIDKVKEQLKAFDWILEAIK